MRHDSEVQGGGKVAVRGEEAKPSNIQPEQERCWHNGRRKNFIVVIGICPYLTKSLRWNWRIERTRTGVGCQKRWPISFGMDKVVYYLLYVQLKDHEVTPLSCVISIVKVIGQ